MHRRSRHRLAPMARAATELSFFLLFLTNSLSPSLPLGLELDQGFLALSLDHPPLGPRAPLHPSGITAAAAPPPCTQGAATATSRQRSPRPVVWSCAPPATSSITYLPFPMTSGYPRHRSTPPRGCRCRRSKVDLSPCFLWLGYHCPPPCCRPMRAPASRRRPHRAPTGAPTAGAPVGRSEPRSSPIGRLYSVSIITLFRRIRTSSELTEGSTVILRVPRSQYSPQLPP